MKIKYRYVVISYDDDQQQSFGDFVEAKDYKQAMELIGIARPYAIPVDVFTPTGLLKLANDLKDTTSEEMDQHMKELLATA